MGKKNAVFGVASAVLIIVAGATLAFSTVERTGTSERAVMLQDGPYEFDGPAEPGVFARLTSISDEDALLRVTMYLTPAATGVEEKRCIMEAPRTRSGSQSIEAAINDFGLSSGDMVRAVYETLDAGGVLVYSSERSLAQP